MTTTRQQRDQRRQARKNLKDLLKILAEQADTCTIDNEGNIRCHA